MSEEQQQQQVFRFVHLRARITDNLILNTQTTTISQAFSHTTMRAGVGARAAVATACRRGLSATTAAAVPAAGSTAAQRSSGGVRRLLPSSYGRAGPVRARALHSLGRPAVAAAVGAAACTAPPPSSSSFSSALLGCVHSARRTVPLDPEPDAATHTCVPTCNHHYVESTVRGAGSRVVAKIRAPKTRTRTSSSCCPTWGCVVVVVAGLCPLHDAGCVRSSGLPAGGGCLREI